MSPIGRFFGSARGREAAPLDPPRPARLTYAIGDIHGMYGLLGEMRAAIQEDAGSAPHDIVFLGDYVDRGPHSRRVLTDLMDFEQSASHVVCLRGNHDQALLDFLDAPAANAHWLSWGGQETAASFGVFGLAGGGSLTERLERMGAAMSSAVDPALRDWVADRPLWWRSGSLVAVHGLTRPTIPMEQQDAETLLWARPGRDLAPRDDGAWVVHGHTIVPNPLVRAGHISIDTGAFRGGPLTAAVIEPDVEPRFLQVGT
ncbi:MAG: metallophosphoesterase family protein [Pseudomonadota bacterium]